MVKFDLLRIGQWFYYNNALYRKITYENGKTENAENINTGEQITVPLTAGVTIWTPWINLEESS
jgi:hypothetical protein